MTRPNEAQNTNEGNKTDRLKRNNRSISDHEIEDLLRETKERINSRDKNNAYDWKKKKTRKLEMKNQRNSARKKSAKRSAKDGRSETTYMCITKRGTTRRNKK